jgi:hypothetical protein
MSPACLFERFTTAFFAARVASFENLRAAMLLIPVAAGPDLAAGQRCTPGCRPAAIAFPGPNSDMPPQAR